MHVAPNAQIDDAQFDIVVMGDMNTVESLAMSQRIYKGNSFRGASHYTCAYRVYMHLL